MALTREHGFPFWLAGGTVLRGWGLTGPEGVAQLRQGLADWEATKALTHRPYHLGLLAEALGREAQFKEALGAVAEALAVTERTGERFYEAELHRLRGELLLRRGAAGGEAEVCFRQALAVAARQGARSLELRAALSLARLLGRPGRPTLAEAYGRFTEGWDTPDLQEAKALLDELA
jgi:predicted ATPase